MSGMVETLGAGPGGLPAAAESGVRSGLTVLQLTAEAFIAFSFLGILFGLVWIVRRRPDLGREYRPLIWAGGIFLLLSAAAHFLGAAAAALPAWHGAVGVANAAVAILASATVVLLLPLLPQLARAPSAAQLAQANDSLRREVAGHEVTLRELETVQRELETRVVDRTRELSTVKARLETALRGAYVHAFSQDRELRYTWVYDPAGDGADGMIGRTDEELFPVGEREAVVTIKRRVLESGEAETCELTAVNPHERALYAVHLAPARGLDGQIDGLTGAAIDISRLRSLESEQRRLADELRTALQRYEMALRGSHMTLFTQDRDLRFTSISNPLFGRDVAEIVGRTDEEILPAESLAQFGALARDALATGKAQGGEVSVKAADTRWYELHVEPLPEADGTITGVACALFDITERKTGESHLRLLMRELTHRSKNLLAVIQAMARQTARHSAGNIETFLEAFGARLQALATSHDLLVQEGWYGASLGDLTRRQLSKYLDGAAKRVSVEGPAVHLKPAAAQSYGLALHELAMNAERYGALSVPGGRVDVEWHMTPAGETGEEGVEILWAEKDGPDVTAPATRGFGTLVVEKNLARALDAEVVLSFDPGGVRCRMVIPGSHLLAAR
ncbi:MAG: PAS domain-containing protein [Rhodoplanes sp.]|uniref:HWE histidine kinase domain-containing protein n=1 Tax=Rhodoplanes sp. TaxID=1968906 RepID=UPI0018018687|nr:HWE histidine kinase domain-containing protein [Rhodoplanes sp.]NVO12847.1 PAS domain-containing protein [Rhodoplanes sp.]